MIINCQSCSRKFLVKDENIPKTGRMGQSGYCSARWHQMPFSAEVEITEAKSATKVSKASSDDLSVDAIKASDGKTYKFLGSQWAQLLPSGKTGLFAKKKIGKELDKLTGRKSERESIPEKRTKKVKKEMDPSTESLSDERKLPDIYKSKGGLGFFGYIFLLIIIAFSIVGALRTFENDLVNYYPESEYIYQLLDEQLEYVSESIKNIIIIIQDLINSY